MDVWVYFKKKEEEQRFELTELLGLEPVSTVTNKCRLS